MLEISTKRLATALTALLLCSNPLWALNTPAGSPTVTDVLVFGTCEFTAQMQPGGAIVSGGDAVSVSGGAEVSVGDGFDSYLSVPSPLPVVSTSFLDTCGTGGNVSNLNVDGANGTYASDGYVGFSFNHTINGVTTFHEVAVTGTTSSTISILPSASPVGLTVTLSPDSWLGAPGATINVVVDFSSTVFDFTLNDLQVANGTIGISDLGQQSNPFTIPIQVSSNAGFGNDLIVNLQASSVQDISGGSSYPAQSITIPVKLSGSSGNLQVEETKAAIATYLLARADQLAVNQPDLIRFLQGEQCGALNASATENGQNIDGCISRGNTWAELTAAWADDSEFTLATIGTHRAINPNLIIGGMLQLDRASGEADASLGHADISGHGWMVGPYFAAQLRDQPIYFEGRLLYGQSDNEITLTPNFGPSFTDNFQTERMLAQLRVMGEYKLQNTTLMPLFDFTYTDDTQDSYVDSLGNTIDAQTVALTQLTAGLDFSRPIEVQSGDFTLNGGLSGIYSASHGTAADKEIVRGRVDLGFVYDLENSGTFSASTFLDGIGADTQSRGLSLTFDMTF